jgi:hypothetical protein
MVRAPKLLCASQYHHFFQMLTSQQLLQEFWRILDFLSFHPEVTSRSLLDDIGIPKDYRHGRFRRPTPSFWGRCREVCQVPLAH